MSTTGRPSWWEGGSPCRRGQQGQCVLAVAEEPETLTETEGPVPLGQKFALVTLAGGGEAQGQSALSSQGTVSNRTS